MDKRIIGIKMPEFLKINKNLLKNNKFQYLCQLKKYLQNE